MWEPDGKLEGGPWTGGDGKVIPGHMEDWRQWIVSGPVQEGTIRTHMLIQFSSNAGIDTLDEANALVAKVLAGLNGAIR